MRVPNHEGAGVPSSVVVGVTIVELVLATGSVEVGATVSGGGATASVVGPLVDDV